MWADNRSSRRGGRVEMTGRRELDVHASGQSTSAAQTMYPDLLTHGTIDIQGAPLDSERAVLRVR